MILTNVDRICLLTDDETRNVFHSKVVDDKVGKTDNCKHFYFNVPPQVHDVSDIIGFTLGQMFPVCNYTSEIECDDEKDYLALLAIRQILRYSGDYLKDKVRTVMYTVKGYSLY